MIRKHTKLCRKMHCDAGTSEPVGRSGRSKTANHWIYGVQFSPATTVLFSSDIDSDTAPLASTPVASSRGLWQLRYPLHYRQC